MSDPISELAASYTSSLRIFYDLAICTKNKRSGLPTAPDEAAYAAIHGVTYLAKSRQREAAQQGDVAGAENADAEVALWALVKAEMDKQHSGVASGSSKAARLFQVLGEIAKPEGVPVETKGA